MSGNSRTRRHPSGNLLLEIHGTSAAPFDRAFESHLIDAHDESRLLGTRGFAIYDAWAGVGSGPAAMTLHELDVGNPSDHVHSDCHARDPNLHNAGPICRAYRELDPVPERDTHEIGSAVLHVQVIVDPKFDDLFLPWYVDEHVPAVLAAPGMITARRFEQIQPGAQTAPGDVPRIYRTVYEMTEASVIARPETLEASLRGACPEEIAPHRQASNRVYTQVFEEIPGA